jgi:hypothetical protein
MRDRLLFGHIDRPIVYWIKIVPQEPKELMDLDQICNPDLLKHMRRELLAENVQRGEDIDKAFNSYFETVDWPIIASCCFLVHDLNDAMSLVSENPFNIITGGSSPSQTVETLQTAIWRLRSSPDSQMRSVY